MKTDRRRPGRTDLYIVGLGIRGASQVTREAEGVLRRCRRAFAMLPIPEMLRYLRTLTPRVVDLRHLYVNGKARLKTYEAMAEAVLAGAQASPPVAFVVYGHPLVCTTPSQILLERAPQLGLVATALPAISSLDCLLTDLRLDPLADGLQVYEATDVLLRKRLLQTDVPCFIFQPGTVESDLHCAAPSRANRFRRLKEHLLRYYARDHEVVVAACAMGPGYPTTLTRVALGKLESARRSLRGPATLYVPPARTRRVKDRALEGLLMSVSHARSITGYVGPRPGLDAADDTFEDTEAGLSLACEDGARAAGGRGRPEPGHGRPKRGGHPEVHGRAGDIAVSLRGERPISGGGAAGEFARAGLGKSRAAFPDRPAREVPGGTATRTRF